VAVVQDIGHAMSAFMLEYWDKENWNVTLTDNTRVLAGLEHGAKEGARDFGKRVTPPPPLFSRREDNL